MANMVCKARILFALIWSFVKLSEQDGCPYNYYSCTGTIYCCKTGYTCSGGYFCYSSYSGGSRYSSGSYTYYYYSSSSSGSSVGVIIGIIIGSLVFICCITAICSAFKKKGRIVHPTRPKRPKVTTISHNRTNARGEYGNALPTASV